MREPKFWTAQETELARDLLLKNASHEQFILLLGRTKKSADSKLRRADKYTFGTIKSSGHYVQGSVPIPKEVVADRNRRLVARMQLDLTAVLMGDPEPGRRT
jgi:hypothetical protein